MESITNKNVIISKILGRKAVKHWQGEIVYGSEWLLIFLTGSRYSNSAIKVSLQEIAYFYMSGNLLGFLLIFFKDSFIRTAGQPADLFICWFSSYE